MTTLFLTLGCDDYYDDMVRDHEERHRAYCAKWRYQYLAEDPAEAVRDRFGRIDFLLNHLRSGHYEYVFWIDADTLVADFSHDMRETLPEWAWLALTIHPYPSREDVIHFQTGTMYARSCEESIRFFERVLALRQAHPDDSEWNDQEAMNALFYTESRWQRGLHIVSHRWNNNLHDQPRGREIVAAWHGACDAEERRMRMLEFARERPYD
jgi:hypothetical protein